MVSLSDAKSAAWSCLQNRKFVPEDRHLFVPCLDTSTQDLLVNLADICDFIDDNRQCPGEHGNVLVHCAFGVSRSAMVAVAYLMWRHRQSLDASLAAVRRSRKVKPNSNFTEQLAVWADPDKKTPKEPYAAYLARRGERLRGKGLTGDEPTCPDLYRYSAYATGFRGTLRAMVWGLLMNTVV